jgi:hypothetical protein
MSCGGCLWESPANGWAEAANVAMESGATATSHGCILVARGEGEGLGGGRGRALTVTWGIVVVHAASRNRVDQYVIICRVFTRINGHKSEIM